MNDSPESPETKGQGGSGLYLGVVAGLLILIMTMLATLWLRERSARIAAQEELTHCRQQVEQFRRMLELLSAEDQPRTRPTGDQPAIPNNDADTDRP